MKRFFKPLLLSFVLIVLGAGIFMVSAQEKTTNDTSSTSISSASAAGTSNLGRYIGAGIAIAGGCLGAGLGMGRIGSAAMGAISEKPELLGISLVFVAMAEGLSIIGFVVAFLILNSK